MTIDLKTKNIKPKRRTFDHLAKKLGPDTNPSRYQEAVLGLQPIENQHYRPTWDPKFKLYDPERSAIRMEDYDDLLDPRQHYYGTWTLKRGKQQETQERNFELVEERQLFGPLKEEDKKLIAKLVVPSRHISWAANTNNSYIAAYGFGAPVTSACAMHMMDHLGIAQYVSRIGLIVFDNDPSVLVDAKAEWMDAAIWQPFRKLVEDSMVCRDWFELFVLQNLLIDATLNPLIFDKFGADIAKRGGLAYVVLCEFMNAWFSESSRWVDAVIGRVVSESEANKTIVQNWITLWNPIVQNAIAPLADNLFETGGVEINLQIQDDVSKRLSKVNLTL